MSLQMLKTLKIAKEHSIVLCPQLFMNKIKITNNHNLSIICDVIHHVASAVYWLPVLAAFPDISWIMVKKAGHEKSTPFIANCSVTAASFSVKQECSNA